MKLLIHLQDVEREGIGIQKRGLKCSRKVSRFYNLSYWLFVKNKELSIDIKKIVENNYYDFGLAKTPGATISAVLGDFIRNGDTRVKE